MANTDQIRALREQTGAGIMECQKALKTSEGDIARAVAFLRESGMIKADKKAGRATEAGLIYAYIHPGSKIGVLLEVNCETDFVARNEQFCAFVKDLALHIAGSSPAPRYIQKEDVPASLTQDVGPLLMEMPFIKDPSITIRMMLTQAISKIGENVVIRRFTRYQLGEENTPPFGHPS